MNASKSIPLPPPTLQFAPVLGLRAIGPLLALLAALMLLAFAQHGELKPKASWAAMDLLGEGGLCLMLALWLGQLRASRPAGPVTDALALGLAAWWLGSVADLLDELWKLPAAVWWDKPLESGMVLLGTLALTWGLHGWRGEQLALSAERRRRERGLRDHRQLDATTALADADYMAAQIEAERRQGGGGCLLMLGADGFDTLLREAGLSEADRWLAQAGQLLCLNLGADELVCRYGGDRFVLLLPKIQGEAAAALAETLRAALAGFSFASADGRRHQLPVRAAWTPLDAAGDAHALMLALARRLAP